LEERSAFSDSTAKTGQPGSEVEVAYDRVSETGRRALQGVPGAVDELKQAVATFRQVIQKLKTEARGIRIPPGATAQKFHQAYMNWLDGHESVAQVEFADLIRVVEDPNLDADTKKAKLRAIFLDAVKNEERRRKAFNEIYQTYAQENGFSPKK
jgi:hypothetical protein